MWQEKWSVTISTQINISRAWCRKSGARVTGGRPHVCELPQGSLLGHKSASSSSIFTFFSAINPVITVPPCNTSTSLCVLCVFFCVFLGGGGGDGGSYLYGLSSSPWLPLHLYLSIYRQMLMMVSRTRKMMIMWLRSYVSSIHVNAQVAGSAEGAKEQ